MVGKSAKEQELESTEVDTVLITYIKPNSDTQYNLSYRVDPGTKASKLREDACSYWGVSQVEFILKTIDNSKVHDDLDMQKCFRQNEVSQLILTQKEPKKTFVLESERLNFGPKLGKKQRMWRNLGKKETEVETTGQVTQRGHIIDSMRALPGLWAFVTQRDQHEVRHLQNVKLRNICIYVILLVMTLAVLIVTRPPNLEYYLLQGVEKGMTESWVDQERGVTVPRFQDVQSRNEAWEWLRYTVSKELFDNNSALRRENYAPGWVQLRMQQVTSPAHTYCGTNDNQRNAVPKGISCLADVYSSSGSDRTSGEADLEGVKFYWEGCNQSNATLYMCTDWDNEQVLPSAGPVADLFMSNWNTSTALLSGKAGRSPVTKPWQFVTSKANDDQGGSEAFLYQPYDGSGYVINYDLQHSMLNQTFTAYREDMERLYATEWGSPTVRSVSVQFTLYNGNYDRWIACWFLLEFPPNGELHANVDLVPFRPYGFKSQDDKFLGVVDLSRFVLVFYITTYNIYSNIRFQRSMKRSAAHYLCRPMGLADILIGVTFYVTMALRHISFGRFLIESLTYRIDLQTTRIDAQAFAHLFQTQTILEAVLLAFVMFRLLSFMRINRHVFIIWTTVEVAMQSFSHFALVLVPVLLGFVMIAHSLWGYHYHQYSSFESSYVGVLMTIHGNPREQVSNTGTYTDLIYEFTFYVVYSLIILNSWIAVFVQTFQQVRVKYGYKPSDYRWKEYHYIKFSLWSPFQMIYFNYIRKNIWKPKEVPEGEE
jgi:hypothetical protein